MQLCFESVQVDDSRTGTPKEGFSKNRFSEKAEYRPIFVSKLTRSVNRPHKQANSSNELRVSNRKESRVPCANSVEISEESKEQTGCLKELSFERKEDTIAQMHLSGETTENNRLKEEDTKIRLDQVGSSKVPLVNNYSTLTGANGKRN